jgi:hypothetical protein
VGTGSLTGLVERIESSHSIWLFDTDRHVFRRVPRGTSEDSLALDSDWEPYFGLEIDDDTGAFTVQLNEEGTRLLRAFRDSNGPGGDSTTELPLS